jgi:hypothetical protein
VGQTIVFREAGSSVAPAIFVAGAFARGYAAICLSQRESKNIPFKNSNLGSGHLETHCRPWYS